MEYETIPRALYLKLLEDGKRVDRVRELVQKLRSSLKEAPDLKTKQITQQLLFKIEFALMDTSQQYLKLEEKKRTIRRIEEELKPKGPYE